MNDQIDELRDLLSELSMLLLTEETVDSTLRRAAGLAVCAIPHCDACGVSMLVEGRVGTGVATSDVARRIDERQYAAHDGPCIEAIRSGEAILVSSVAEQPRWPVFRKEAELEGLVSSYSLPLRVRDQSVGAMNLYSLSTPFGEADVRVIQDLASHAAITLANVHAYKQTQDLVQNLNEALKTREAIGQATGIIMERESCSAEAAFEILRSASQQANIKVRDFARQIVTAPRAGAGAGPVR